MRPMREMEAGASMIWPRVTADREQPRPSHLGVSLMLSGVSQISQIRRIEATGTMCVRDNFWRLWIRCRSRLAPHPADLLE